MSMSWMMSSSGELSQLIKSGSITFDEVIAHGELKEDFRRQDTTLHNYLLNHAKELTNTALGIQNAGNDAAQCLAFQLIISQVQLFSRKLAQTKDFLQAMHDALFGGCTFEGKSGPAFARIFQYMIQSSLTPFLVSLPEKERVFSELVKHRDVPAIANLLVFLTDNSDTRVTNFLECNDAVNVLLSNLKGTDDDRAILRYILNVTGSVEFDSKVLVPLADAKVIGKIFEIGMSAKNHFLAEDALGIILQLVSSYDDYCEVATDTNLMQNTLKFLTGHINELCAFIKADGVFLKPKFNAVELLGAAAIMLTAIPPEIWDVLEFLWKKIFEFPSHTFLHRSFLTLFESILSDSPCVDEFIDRIGMHHTIVATFAKKKEVIASYWSCLYTVADFISIRGRCDKEWNGFIRGTLAKTTEIISRNYGGHMPSFNCYDSSDSGDFQFKKDLVFDSDSDDDDDDFVWNKDQQPKSSILTSDKDIFDSSDSSDDEDYGISSTNKLLYQGTHFASPFSN